MNQAWLPVAMALLVSIAGAQSPGLNLRLSSDSLLFGYRQDGLLPGTQTLTVTSTTPSLRFDISTNASWLKPAREWDIASATLRIDTNPTGLMPGVHTAMLRLSAGSEYREIPVTLVVETRRPQSELMSRVYFADQDDLVILDGETMAPTARIPVFNRWAIDMKTSPDGLRLYVSYSRDNRVMVLDLRTLQTRWIALQSSEGLAVSPDGTRLYVSQSSRSVAAVDTSTFEVVQEVPMVGFRLAMSTDGGRLLKYDNALRIVDAAKMTVIDEIKFGTAGNARCVALSPDASTAYVAFDGPTNGIYALDLFEKTARQVVRNDQMPFWFLANDMEFSPDGRQLYVFGISGGFAVIDTKTRSLSRTVRVEFSKADAFKPFGSMAVELRRAAPGIFTANADGKGAPAGFVVNHSANEPLYACGAASGTCRTRAFTGDRENVLVLYGTGFRFAPKESIRASISGRDATVLYAGPHSEWPGLDQLNVRVPQSVRGAAEVRLSADERSANPVEIEVQ